MCFLRLISYLPAACGMQVLMGKIWRKQTRIVDDDASNAGNGPEIDSGDTPALTQIKGGISGTTLELNNDHIGDPNCSISLILLLLITLLCTLSNVSI